MIRTIVALLSALLLVAPAFAETCNIKGNVSTKGERIYHVPGQRYYEATKISASHGERWFAQRKKPGRPAGESRRSSQSPSAWPSQQSQLNCI